MSNVTSKKSYTIIYSNVAQLFSNRIKKTDGTWVYIEGMGTVVGKIENKVKFSSGERDVFTGYVYGSGETGITERAKMAFDEIIREFENDYGSNSRPASLKINIFGFSRGAATARHFIHLAKTQPNLFKKWGLKANVYRNIELAFAPKGWIILFVTGPGIRKEIASWQAKVVTPSDEVMNEVTYNYYGKVKRGEEENIFRKDFKQTHPELYRRLETGEWKINSDWYKMMQTKFPWNLEVVAEEAKWTGEYYIEYANTDKYETLSDQVAQHKTELKPVPTKITTWVITNKSNEKYYIEFHMFPIPNWLAPRYTPYYQDPNLTYFFKRFQYFYPKRSLATNNQPAKPEEFATLKIHMTDKGYMDEIYLQKGTEKLPIEGAYEYYISEVDPTRGGYLPYLDGVDYYRTKPKIKDLSDPLFVDLD